MCYFSGRVDNHLVTWFWFHSYTWVAILLIQDLQSFSHWFSNQFWNQFILDFTKWQQGTVTSAVFLGSTFPSFTSHHNTLYLITTQPKTNDSSTYLPIFRFQKPPTNTNFIQTTISHWPINCLYWFLHSFDFARCLFLDFHKFLELIFNISVSASFFDLHDFKQFLD